MGPLGLRWAGPFGHECGSAKRRASGRAVEERARRGADFAEARGEGVVCKRSGVVPPAACDGGGADEAAMRLSRAAAGRSSSPLPDDDKDTPPTPGCRLGRLREPESEERTRGVLVVALVCLQCGVCWCRPFHSPHARKRACRLQACATRSCAGQSWCPWQFFLLLFECPVLLMSVPPLVREYVRWRSVRCAIVSALLAHHQQWLHAACRPFRRRLLYGSVCG